MHSKSGLTFADYLIIIAIVLLLASLAIPRFRKPEDHGPDENATTSTVTNVTNAPDAATSDTAATTNTPP